MRKAICAVLFLAFCPFLIAQQVPFLLAQQEQALNNDSIIKMVNAQLSEKSSSPPSMLRRAPTIPRLTPSSPSSRPASATK